MADHLWDAITAVSTAAAAAFTAIMAGLTFKAIKDGQGQRQDTNDHFAATRELDTQHHEDTYRPLLVLTPFNIMDPLNRSTFLSADPSKQLMFLRCAIRNIGPGPALNVRLSVWVLGKKGYGPTRELSPMSAGETRSDPKGNIPLPVVIGPNFNDTDLAFATSAHWVLVLEYQDVFGTPFHTLHSKNPADPWTRFRAGIPADAPADEIKA